MGAVAVCVAAALFAAGVAPLVAPWSLAFGGDLEPRDARAKIDKVRVTKAPYMRLYATVLDLGGLPLKPEKINETIVLCNGSDIEEKIETFAFQDLPDEMMDLAIIMPLSPRLPVEVQDKIKASVSDVLGQVRETDRAMLLVDDGRGITSSGLGAAGTAADLLGTLTPRTHSSFLVSALDRAIQTLISDGDKARKRAIIVITDGLDSETITPSELDQEFERLIAAARAAVNPDEQGYGTGITIHVVLFRPVRPEMAPSFEALSRKTQGTFRSAADLTELELDIKLAFGELYGQLVFDFVMSLDEGDQCNFSLEIQRTSGSTLRTPAFQSITFKKVGMTWFWIIFWIVVAVIVLIIIIIIVRHFLAKRRERLDAEAAAAAEAQAAADAKAAEEAAAAEAAAAEQAAKDAEEAEKAAKEPPKPKLPPPKRQR